MCKKIKLHRISPHAQMQNQRGVNVVKCHYYNIIMRLK